MIFLISRPTSTLYNDLVTQIEKPLLSAPQYSIFKTDHELAKIRNKQASSLKYLL